MKPSLYPYEARRAVMMALIAAIIVLATIFL